MRQSMAGPQKITLVFTAEHTDLLCFIYYHIVFIASFLFSCLGYIDEYHFIRTFLNFFVI